MERCGRGYVARLVRSMDIHQKRLKAYVCMYKQLQSESDIGNGIRRVRLMCKASRKTKKRKPDPGEG
jgi:hypothetical protein